MDSRLPPKSSGVNRREFLSDVGTASALAYISPPVLTTGPERTGSQARAVETVTTADGTSVQHQPVVGNCDDLFAYVSQWGVTDHLGRSHPGAWGVTSWEPIIDGTPTKEYFDGNSLTVPLDGRYTVERYDGSGAEYTLQVTGIDVSFDADTWVAVIDWRPTEDPPESCLWAWCDLYEDTVAHERQHAQDAREVTTEANSRLAEELADNPPSVTVFPWDDETEKRAELNGQVQDLLGSGVAWIQRTYAQREEALHQADSYPANFCSQCSQCEETNGPSVTDVDSWDLQVSYHFDARIDYEEGGFHEITEDFSAAYVLERVQNFPGLIAGLIEIFSFLANLLASIFGDDGGTIPDFGRPLLWHGPGTASGTHRATRFVPDDDGGIRQSTVTSGAGRTVTDASIEIQRDRDAYTVDWPGIDSSGTVTTTTPHGTLTDSITIPLHTGELGRYQANGFLRDPTGGGVTPQNLDFSDPVYPLDPCRLVYERNITLDLTGLDAFREVMGPEWTGEATGRETVTWVISPRGFEEESIPDRVTC